VSYAHVFMIVPLTRIRNSSGGGRQQRRRIDISGDDLLRRVHHCNLTTTRFMETTTQRQPTTVLKTKTVWFLVLLCGAVVESSLSHRATEAKQTRVIQSYIKTTRKHDAKQHAAQLEEFFPLWWAHLVELSLYSPELHTSPLELHTSWPRYKPQT
jgi:hypothetical protein